MSLSHFAMSLCDMQGSSWCDTATSCGIATVSPIRERACVAAALGALGNEFDMQFDDPTQLAELKRMWMVPSQLSVDEHDFRSPANQEPAQIINELFRPRQGTRFETNEALYKRLYPITTAPRTGARLMLR